VLVCVLLGRGGRGVVKRLKYLVFVAVGLLIGLHKILPSSVYV
jgi:hypothetical protein